MIDEFAYVRPGTPQDADALAGVFQESWNDAYRGIIPHEPLTAIIARRNAAYWRRVLDQTLRPVVMIAGGTIAGYATFGRARSRGPYEGEIYELYLAPVYQGLGLGEHLFEATRYHLDQARRSGLIVWSLHDNARACAFYERRGGRVIATNTERFGPVRLKKIAYTWT